MAYILSLPREVRDVVLEHVVVACSSAPVDAAAEAPNRYKPTTSKRVRVSRGQVVPNSLGLLLANRQLSVETRNVIVRLRASHRMVYRLDVMIVNDCQLWPTWLSVPAVVPTVDQVHVTFRVFDARRREEPSAYLSNGSPRVIMYDFYYLLQHFLLVVPGDIAMQSLVLDFSNEGPDDGATMNEWLDLHEEYTDEIPEDVDPIVPRARWIGTLVAEYIAQIIIMDYHTARYGGLVYERIGAITVVANGERLLHDDLGAVLAPLSYNDPAQTFGHLRQHEDRLPAFWDWKEAALETRLRFGLPVGSPVAQRPPGLARLHHGVGPESDPPPATRRLKIVAYARVTSRFIRRISRRLVGAR